ncbi:MAG TPA: hypothetical protein VK853_07480 [Ilumatobacteraceae bacterium]|nr:hypothetical protein [Ilumatobacteraceae bacterium]
MNSVHRDVGQAAVVLVMTVAVMFSAAVAGLTVLGGRVADGVRAQTAADAVALASLTGGRSLAADVAERHGAAVVSWTSERDGAVVTVVVTLGDASATARATSAP